MTSTAKVWSYAKFDGARGRLTDADKLVFLHFEKTAGTTVANIIQRSYDPSELFPERSGSVRYWPSSALQRYRLFMVHAALDDLRSIPRPLKVITFLRDPVERLISLYKYWTSFRDEAVQAGNLTFPRYAKSLSFSEFISDKSLRVIPSLWNIYTQHLAGHYTFSPDGRRWRSEGAMLQAALENVEQLAFVGIVETMNSSLQNMQRELGMQTHLDDVRENVTRDLPIVDPQTFGPSSPVFIDDEACERLHNVTKLDRIIYDTVLRRTNVSYWSLRAHNLQIGSGGRCVKHDGEDWVEATRPNDVLLHGPYMPLPAGRYCVSFTTTGGLLGKKQINSGVFDVVANCGKTILTRQAFHANGQPGFSTIELEFQLYKMTKDIEFRAYSGEAPSFLVKPRVNMQRYLG